MQDSNLLHGDGQHICVLLFDGFSNHCLANAVEPLRAANMISGRALYHWQFASLDGAGVASSSGLPVTPHIALEHARGDILMVMPSYGYLKYANRMTGLALRAAATRFQVLAGLDTGSWLLAHAQLLQGYGATIHWDEFDSFSETFADVDARRTRFLLDRDRITCSGATTTFDLLLEMISLRHGPALALEVGQLFMARQGETPGLYQGYRGGRLVTRAITEMRTRIENPITVPMLARMLGCSQRKLEAHVRAELQLTPQALYRRLRLGQGRKFLQETDLKIGEIALRCGYENASAMSRAFRAEFGQSPRAVRAALGRPD